jgi:hypothetical protein
MDCQLGSRFLISLISREQTWIRRAQCLNVGMDGRTHAMKILLSHEKCRYSRLAKRWHRRAESIREFNSARLAVPYLRRTVPQGMTFERDGPK